MIQVGGELVEQNVSGSHLPLTPWQPLTLCPTLYDIIVKETLELDPDGLCQRESFQVPAPMIKQQNLCWTVVPDHFQVCGTSWGAMPGRAEFGKGKEMPGREGLEGQAHRGTALAEAQGPQDQGRVRRGGQEVRPAGLSPN